MILLPKNSSPNLRMFLWVVTVFVILSCQNVCVSLFDYQVRWVVPPANASETFNVWASKQRFQVGDTLRFKYKKDSVMGVTEEEYKQCNSSHPTFFSNTGQTKFKFDQSGPFYFISGMSGHCQKGQKMIVEVISSNPDDDDNDGDKSRPSSSSSSAGASCPTTAVLFVWLCFVLLLQSVSSSVLLCLLV